MSKIKTRDTAAEIFRKVGDRVRERRKLEARATAVEAERPGAFRDLGDFLKTVRNHAAGQSDQRLVRAPTGAGEVDPSAGGFTVPIEYATDLVESLYEESAIAHLVDRRQTTKAETRIPAIDEQSRADGQRHGGTTSFWVDEGTTEAPSLPKFRNVTLSPRKLVSFSVASGELIDDAPMLSEHVRQAFASEASFQLDRTILLGSGRGVPLGILASPALVVVPKDSGQPSGTLTTGNINSMWSRLPAPCRRRAVWLVNEDVESSISQLTQQVGTSGAATPDASMLYFPYAGSLYPHLKGRPVIAIEQAPQIGTIGDIVLADLSQYILADRGSSAVLSLHVLFLQDQGVFRFTMRIDGAPAWTTPITPFNGTQTRSPFVALAAR